MTCSQMPDPYNEKALGTSPAGTCPDSCPGEGKGQTRAVTARHIVVCGDDPSLVLPHLGVGMTADAVAAAIALVTFVWYVYSGRRGWANDVTLRRAEFVRSYTSDFYSANSLAELFFDIDHGRFSFDKSDLGTQSEARLTELLDFFNTVGMSADRGIVSLDDLKGTTIGYATMVTWSDEGVQWFLRHVDGTDEAKRLDTLAFGYFRKVGVALVEEAQPSRSARLVARIKGSSPALPDVSRS